MKRKREREGERKVSMKLVTNVSAKDSRYVKKKDTLKEQKERKLIERISIVVAM